MHSVGTPTESTAVGWAVARRSSQAAAHFFGRRFAASLQQAQIALQLVGARAEPLHIGIGGLQVGRL